MNVDRLSVTVPHDLGAGLRALAQARRTSVSDVVAQAIAHEIRLAALDHALTAADRRFGALADDLVARAEAELTAAARRARSRHRNRRR